ncbi:MAG: hypothetical protein A4E64_02160 [Syntrophorhabdus sp. PtaU1.Bin058]|nr:MAG: hypothetical protein A4E64_02160 [Syntrophorhabdus sp. PtaU1.Bin058]
MKDLELKDPRLFEMVMEEHKRQIKKWGIQNVHPFAWLAYATEEHGEIAEAIIEFIGGRGPQSAVVKEAIREATLNLKIAEIFLNDIKLHKIIVLCGSSRFVDVMAVCAWLLERDEKTMIMGLHLLPQWYPNVPESHIADHEGCAKEMDELHLRKIDLANEIFIVDCAHYIGESTSNEIEYAQSQRKPVRYFSKDPIGEAVIKMIREDLIREINLQEAFAVGDTDFQKWKKGVWPICRKCGCSNNNACPGGCFWVEDDLCSQCAGGDAK